MDSWTIGNFPIPSSLLVIKVAIVLIKKFCHQNYSTMTASLSSFIHPQLRQIVAKMSLFDTILFFVIHFVDKFGLWHKLPVFLGLAYLGIKRHLLQRYNLLHVGCIKGQKYDTEDFPYRTADGKCNHPTDDLVGSQGTFFGRNMPPSTSHYGVRRKYFTIYGLTCVTGWYIHQ